MNKAIVSIAILSAIAFIVAIVAMLAAMALCIGIVFLAWRYRGKIQTIGNNIIGLLRHCWQFSAPFLVDFMQCVVNDMFPAFWADMMRLKRIGYIVGLSLPLISIVLINMLLSARKKTAKIELKTFVESLSAESAESPNADIENIERYLFEPTFLANLAYDDCTPIQLKLTELIAYNPADDTAKYIESDVLNAFDDLMQIIKFNGRHGIVTSIDDIRIHAYVIQVANLFTKALTEKQAALIDALCSSDIERVESMHEELRDKRYSLKSWEDRNRSKFTYASNNDALKEYRERIQQDHRELHGNIERNDLPEWAY
jgi:hypothetical protein